MATKLKILVFEIGPPSLIHAVAKYPFPCLEEHMKRHFSDDVTPAAESWFDCLSQAFSYMN